MISSSEIQETVVKQEYKCKKRAASPKNKTIFTAYCDNPCRHISELKDDKTCACCGRRIKHHQTYEAIMQKFDEIIADNQAFVDGFKLFPAKFDNRFYALVKNGYFTYIIDMKAFVGYMDLANADGDDRYSRFFKAIIDNCPRIPGRLQPNPSI